MHVSLTVYDVLGRLVATLVDEFKMPGDYIAQFNGVSAPDGLYFVVLATKEGVATKTVVVMH
jgi:hypothetical protein